MSKLNLIQRREIEPLILKADKIMKHYEKASNSGAFAINPNGDSLKSCIGGICGRCTGGEASEACGLNLHMEALDKAKQLGGSYIYLCRQGLVFWTSPFYSGERYAGSLLSGGVKRTKHNKEKIKSLAQMMLLCADQISAMSFTQKNALAAPSAAGPAAGAEKNPAASRLLEASLREERNFQTKTVKNFEEGGRQEPENAAIMEMERKLLASLRRGDKEEGEEILTALVSILFQKVNQNFQDENRMAAFRLKAMELAVLLSRAVADPIDIKHNTSLEITNRCIKTIEESSSLKEITDALLVITERMSGKIFSFHGVRHFSAIRKAERFIWTHYTRKLSLREIAAVSGLSAPYFSTIFKEEMGENLSNYLNRLRVEKAITLLVTTEQSISNIARTCGFEDQSWFSKIFKNNTGFTPGKYREMGMGSTLG